MNWFKKAQTSFNEGDMCEVMLPSGSASYANSPAIIERLFRGIDQFGKENDMAHIVYTWSNGKDYETDISVHSLRRYRPEVWRKKTLEELLAEE